MRWNSEHLAGVEFEFPIQFRFRSSSRTLSSTALSTLIDSCCEGRLIQHPTVMDTLPNRQNPPMSASAVKCTWFQPNVVWWFRGGFAVWCWRCLKFKGIHISKGLYLNDYIMIIPWGLAWIHQPLMDDFLVELVAWSWGPSSRASQGKVRPWSKADGLMLMDLGLLYLPVGK